MRSSELASSHHVALYSCDSGIADGWGFLKGLTGSVELAAPEDEPDVTASSMPVENDAGTGIFSKLILFGIIIGAVAAFLKTRKSPVPTEKSLA